MTAWIFAAAWAATTLALIIEIAAGLDLRRENRELLRRLGIRPEDAPKGARHVRG